VCKCSIRQQRGTRVRQGGDTCRAIGDGGRAISDDADGRAPADAELSAAQAGPDASLESESRGGLTSKQREVLDLLIQHKTSKEISRLLGISPHTVDQRILLARSKLHVATRGEVARAYRRLLETERNPAQSGIYEQPIYGFSDVAPTEEMAHERPREDEGDRFQFPQFRQPMPAMAGAAGQELGSVYHPVLPEMFDGPNGTMLRLGAIALIAVFLILVVMGGLAMFVQLSQMIE